MEPNKFHIHFMGVGGIGMSALAEMALSTGARVSGCDRTDGSLIRKLANRGVEVAVGHDPRHVHDADLLVYSSAIPADHPERLAARDRQEMRGQFLARMMRDRVGLGVSGTHGKTTTSWLLAHILIHAGLDPAVFIGGIVPDLPEGNHRLGAGPFVTELDESDASFLLPKLRVAVITNIESDHLSHYRSDDALFDAFRRFAGGVAEDGILIAGIDNPGAASVFSNHQGRKVSFALNRPADLYAVDIKCEPGNTRFQVLFRGGELGQFSLSLPGVHNVQNALAALGAALESGVDADTARRALATARGVERRLENIGRVGGAVLYSDYAHHPTEVAASIAALRQRHGGSLLVVFQPHLYTRTRDYADAFGDALALADAVLLVDIYPAREDPIPGVDSSLLATAVRRHNPHVHGPVALADTAARARELADGFAAVVMMGAGDIDNAARELAARGEGGNANPETKS